MITKILAAKRAARSGAGTIIASGREENVLVRLAQGEAIGTHLSPASSVLHAKSSGLPTICGRLAGSFWIRVLSERLSEITRHSFRSA